MGIAPLKRIVVGMGVALASGVGMTSAAQECVGNEGIKEEVYDDVNEIEGLLEIFTVDKQAEFEGGNAALIRWIKENMVYPKICEEQWIQGRLFVQFAVDKDGSLSDVEVIRGGAHEKMDEEAVRLVKSMPKWKPAEKGGKIVRSRFVLPVVFRLEE